MDGKIDDFIKAYLMEFGQNNALMIFLIAFCKYCIDC